MRKMMMAVAIVALGMGATGCATKKYVNTRVTDVNDKVTTISKISRRRRSARARTSSASAKWTRRPTRPDSGRRGRQGRLGRDERRLGHRQEGDATSTARSRRLVFEVVLQEDKARFANGKAALAPDAKAELDELVTQLAANPQNYFLEIEGHTDSRGSTMTNERLGLERAEAVKRYLYEQHNVPLHKMNVISFGETQAGRAEHQQGRTARRTGAW